MYYHSTIVSVAFYLWAAFYLLAICAFLTHKSLIFCTQVTWELLVSNSHAATSTCYLVANCTICNHSMCSENFCMLSCRELTNLLWTVHYTNNLISLVGFTTSGSITLSFWWSHTVLCIIMLNYSIQAPQIPDLSNQGLFKMKNLEVLW